MYEESSNTVLKQEVFKYNRLLRAMHGTLPLFRKALKGLVAMSEELDAMGTALYGNVVPPNFAKVGYLNEKPLSSWIKDVIQRVDFLQLWLDVKRPYAYWVSGFFFPQAFLTAVLQNNARRDKIAIDRLSMDFRIDSSAEVDGSNYTDHPGSGCRIYGIFVEGCKWERSTQQLEESDPKLLYSELPPVTLTPMTERKIPEGTYRCPMYKTLSRRGTLSTTGHSTNFVMYIDLPTDKPGAVWIIAGVATFLALNT